MEEPRSRIRVLPRRVVDWLCAGRQDYRDFQRRKSSRSHRARRGLCVWVWAGAAGLMLICSQGACVITLLLGATFLSFAVLDGE